MWLNDGSSYAYGNSTSNTAMFTGIFLPISRMLEIEREKEERESKVESGCNGSSSYNALILLHYSISYTWEHSWYSSWNCCELKHFKHYSTLQLDVEHVHLHRQRRAWIWCKCLQHNFSTDLWIFGDIREYCTVTNIDFIQIVCGLVYFGFGSICTAVHTYLFMCTYIL